MMLQQKDIKDIHLMLDLDDAGRTAANNIIKAYKDKSLFKISENEFIEERELDVKSVKFFLNGHENLKINDLNQLLQVKKYFDENSRKRELAKENPELYYDAQKQKDISENDDIEKLDQEEFTHDNF